jgi:hypothetical protein
MEIKNKDNTKGVIVKRVSEVDLATECRCGAKAEFVYNNLVPRLTRVPDTYEDGVVVNSTMLGRIGGMKFSHQEYIVRYIRFNKLTYNKSSRTYKLNKTTLNVKFGKRLRKRIRRTLDIDITFTVTDLTPFLYNPIESECKFPDIGE